MEIKYRARTVEAEIKRAAREFPVVAVTGPRQTGKSTLLRKMFPRYHYDTLDDRTLLNRIRQDPFLYFENRAPFLILDEIQYAPELLSIIKIIVDRKREQNGQFILTGSQIFPLMAGISESLAGRIGLFELLGFSWEELGVSPNSSAECFQKLWKGFYPQPSLGRVQPKSFYSSYLTTYLERDIRQIQSVQDLSIFQRYLELLAARVGSLLNLSEISKECGISHPTARQWLSLLESTRIVYLLRPYFANVTKRVVRSPKIYFTDTGLLAFILKYADPATMMAGPMAGAFFENMVVIEALKAKLNHGALCDLYFFRDSNGNEVDLVIDHGLKKDLVEIKFSKSIRMEHALPLSRIQTEIPNSSAFLATLSGESEPVLPNVQAILWKKVLELIR